MRTALKTAIIKNSVNLGDELITNGTFNGGTTG